MKIETLKAACYVIPTDSLESDGTLEWSQTSLVTVHLTAAGKTGFGYTYCQRAAAVLIEDMFKDLVVGQDPMDVNRLWWSMARVARNLGRPGIVSSAIAAVDTALWDLKARCLDLPLVKLLGQIREAIPVYGSGGFTSYSVERLQSQFRDWAESGIEMAKMKVASHPEDDLARVRAAREALGPSRKLFVDANGGYTRKQALSQAERFSELDVTWFEEPVSSDDLEGLSLIRDRAPLGMDIAAGEYGYDSYYFRRMIEAGAVDTLQADASRCGGLTGFLQASALCESFALPLSAHTAPTLHAHVCCASKPAVHVEYFYDHSRIETLLFDGVLKPIGGALKPDLSRPGLGVDFKFQDAEKFAVSF